MYKNISTAYYIKEKVLILLYIVGSVSLLKLMYHTCEADVYYRRGLTYRGKNAHDFHTTVKDLYDKSETIVPWEIQYKIAIAGNYENWSSNPELTNEKKIEYLKQAKAYYTKALKLNPFHYTVRNGISRTNYKLQQLTASR